MTVSKPLLIAGAMIQILLVAGCNNYRVVPTHLETQVNKRLSYQDAQAHPASSTGQMVVWGGEVLKSTHSPDKTRIEVLQLPLTDDLVPSGERTGSAGRFVALDTQGKIIDPAVVPEGTRVTIVGEVQEPATVSSDPGTQEYPMITIRDMTVWDKKMSRAWPRSYYGPYYGHYYYGYRPYVFWDGARVPGS